MTHAVPDQALELIAFGHAVRDQGLAGSTCGNVSVRLEDGRIAISGSGTSIGSLEPDGIALVGLADAAHFAGPKPSMETELHRRAYQQRPKVGAVLHCQSRSATLAACMADPPHNLDLIPEIPAYVRRHAYVPYHAPGSDALAEAVERALDDPDVTVIQLRNHGQIIVGKTWGHVIRRGVFFELACWLATQGQAVAPIPDAEADALRSFAKDL